MLFWKLWECLTIPIKKHSMTLQETFMLICIQRIIFITDFFFNILQGNMKLVILGNLGMPGHTQFQETFDVHLQAKKQPHLSCFPWGVVKILQYVILSTLGMPGYAHPKWSMNLQKILCLSAGIKSTSSCSFSWRYSKDIQTSYFGYFGHAWPGTLKKTVSN